MKRKTGSHFPNPNAPNGIYMPLEQVEGNHKANRRGKDVMDERIH